jgi:hypothetical protein
MKMVDVYAVEVSDDEAAMTTSSGKGQQDLINK